MSHHVRAHVRIATSLFAGLGFQVGLWAVLVPELVASRGLGPGALGVALGVLAATSILSLSAAGLVADRVGRRPLACAGSAGIGLALGALATVEARWALLPTVAFYGMANGLLDLGANTIGADVEREHRIRVMIRLHAGFSAAAALAALGTAGALAAGIDAAALYAAGGAALCALAAVMARAPLPPHPATAGGADRVAVAGGADLAAVNDADLALAGSADVAGVGAADLVAASGTDLAADEAARGSLLRASGVLVAIALITICFFGDGALEGYFALYMRELLGAGALLSGVGLAAFHAASLAGRLLSARALHRLGERNLITLAGAAAASGMLLVVLAQSAPLAAVGLLIVGASLAPVVPTALSVAGRSSPTRAGAAVSLVTTVGYGAFVLGPPLIGALADATSLRTAMVPVVASTALLAVIARRL
jgi:MFS family permease